MYLFWVLIWGEGKGPLLSDCQTVWAPRCSNRPASHPVLSQVKKSPITIPNADWFRGLISGKHLISHPIYYMYTGFL